MCMLFIVSVGRYIWIEYPVINLLHEKLAICEVEQVRFSSRHSFDISTVSFGDGKDIYSCMHELNIYWLCYTRLKK